jgi:HlyD family secretion protein
MGTATQENLERLLGTPRAGKELARYAWRVGVLAVLLLFVWLGYSRWKVLPGKGIPLYETERVVRGNLHVTVTATGSLEPTRNVDVGSELSGLIESVLVQENDQVKKGETLAVLDSSRLKVQITLDQATLASAQAKLAQSEATVKESTASLERLREVSRLSDGKVPSKTEMATAEATLARALADQSNSRAVIDQGRAQLSSDEVNLSKASIRAPIDGVVLSRSVEPGQTVAASLQVTTLFTIAEDLRNMELKVDVDEADVGAVKNGQAASFTVDAYPGRIYRAKVKRVAYGAHTKDNVVSYSAVLIVKNDDLSLRPGMTATAEISTTAKQNVLLVPNAALHFTPSANVDRQQSGELVGSLIPGPPRGNSSSATAQAKGSSQQVWTLRNGRAIPISVSIGAGDGNFTEVTGGDVEEGMPVITDAEVART